MHNPYSPPRSSLRDVGLGHPAGPSRTVSRWLLAVELFLIAVPSTFLLLVFGVVGAIPGVVQDPDFANVALAAASGVAFAGLIAGWVLGLSFVIRGGRALTARRWWWWALGAGGGVVAVLGLVSSIVHPDPYSPMRSFLESFGMFALGLPLLLPFVHLAIERRRSGPD